MAESLGGMHAIGFSTGGSEVLEQSGDDAALLTNASGSRILARAGGR